MVFCDSSPLKRIQEVREKVWGMPQTGTAQHEFSGYLRVFGVGEETWKRGRVEE